MRSATSFLTGSCSLLFVVIAVAYAQCTAPPRDDNRCGPSFGSASCAFRAECCSQHGWCGTTPDHCNAFSICPKDDASSTARGDRPASNADGLSTFNWCGIRPWIALSFDGGFSEPEITNLLADLAANSIKASFFLSPASDGPPQPGFCGSLANIVRGGHTIEHHSFTHPSFQSISAAQRLDEVNQLVQWIVSSCGFEPKFQQFRPPYGMFNRGMVQEVNALGLTATGWTIDSDDYNGGDSSKVFANVMAKFNALPEGSSALILHHDFTYNDAGTKGIVGMYKRQFPQHRFVSSRECFEACRGDGSCKLPQDVWPGVFDYEDEYTYP